MSYWIAAFQHAVAPRLLPSGERMTMQDALLIVSGGRHWLWQERSAHLAQQRAPAQAQLWLNVADGVSASPEAALASRTYLQCLLAEVQSAHSKPHAAPSTRLAHALIRSAYARWQQQYLRSATFGASTTLASVVVEQNRFCAINCGDSRIWLIRPLSSGGVQWQQLSRDHNTWQDMLDRGEVQPEQRGDYASIYSGLMHCLTLGDTDDSEGWDDDEPTPGTGGDKPVLHTTQGTLKPGDTLIVATDGLHDTLGEPTMRSLWQPQATLDANLKAWQSAFLKARAPDDISVVALRL